MGNLIAFIISTVVGITLMILTPVIIIVGMLRKFISMAYRKILGLDT